jgi:hypothetical protein
MATPLLAMSPLPLALLPLLIELLLKIVTITLEMETCVGTIGILLINT